MQIKRRKLGVWIINKNFYPDIYKKPAQAGWLIERGI
jgi:hypothetical protein